MSIGTSETKWVGAACAGALLVVGAWNLSSSAQAEARAVPVAPASVATTALAAQAAQRFVGDYRFAGGRAEQEARDAAIEDVVSELNVLVQPIARSRLTEAVPIAERLQVQLDGSKISVAFDGRANVTELDGSSTRVVGAQGDELDYHVELQGSSLTQIFKGERGGRTNALRRKDSGKIVVEVKVHSERLPKPLSYRLTYAPSG